MNNKNCYAGRGRVSSVASRHVPFAGRSLARSAAVFCDAMITAESAGGQLTSRQAEAMPRGTRSYRQAQRVAACLTRWLPAVSSRVQRRLLDVGALPFEADYVRVLGFGSGATVFVVQVRMPGDAVQDLVLKVFRKSLGRKPAELLGHISHYRANYERLREWYADCDMILPTQFLLLHGPLRSQPVAACVQPLIKDRLTDVFHDLTESQLLQRLQSSDGLRAQFVSFVERTLHYATKEAASVDLVGQHNVVLIGSGSRSRLLLLDLGVYAFDRKAVRSPAALKQLEDRIGYLRHIRDIVQTC